jgi:hypothetical protein
MNPYIETFQRVARKLQPVLAAKQIEAHTGEWLGATVLKLQKHAWAKAKPPSTIVNPGIFFSIWIDAQSLKRQRVLYNIHALKLRGLSAYTLESREFATAFRKEFAHNATRWPNVSVDFGPQTLMQGWIALDESTLEADTIRLSRQFLPLARTIDTLLRARLRPARY